MSAVKFKNYAYFRGPKGDKGDKGDPGTGIASTSGRITYNPITKTVGFNETGLATQTYVDTALSSLVDNAPELLNTLNELAAAIGDNANFIVDITADINSKLSLAGGTMTGDLILSGSPVNSLSAATKQYVDDAISSIPMNTDDVIEGTNNLYFTDSRARAAISVTGAGSYDSSTGVINIVGGVTTVNGQNGTVVLDTDDIAEGTNLYFTDARSRSAISVSGDLNYNSVTGVISFTAGAGFSGNYDDLTNKPSIPDSILDLGITDGTNGQYLTTDGTGNFSFTSSSWDGAIFDGGDFDGADIIPGEVAIDAGFLEAFYNPATPANWSGTAPITVSEALDRLAAIVKSLNGGVGA